MICDFKDQQMMIAVSNDDNDFEMRPVILK